MNRFQEHKRELERFAEPGGPLARDSRYATVNNPRFFRHGEHAPEPTRERRELHARLLAEWEAASPGATGRQAIVLAGPPGAGKSSSQKALIDATGIPEEDWRIVNNDDFKDQLLLSALDDGSYERDLLPPELAQSGERVWPRELATLVHDEAGMLADEARKRSIEQGTNVVIDGTLSWEPGANDLMDELDRAGYTVRVAVVDAPQDVVQSARGAPLAQRLSRRGERRGGRSDDRAARRALGSVGRGRGHVRERGSVGLRRRRALGLGAPRLRRRVPARTGDRAGRLAEAGRAPRAAAAGRSAAGRRDLPGGDQRPGVDAARAPAACQRPGGTRRPVATARAPA